ncbi:MAG: histidinol dehydrogenase [Spirochaetota bacterium]
MAVPIRFWEDLSDFEKRKVMSRSEENISRIEDSVKKIIEEVRRRGDTALYETTLRYDGVDLKTTPLRVSNDEFFEAEKTLSHKIKAALAFCIENVRRFHENQKPLSMTLKEIRPGILAGEKAAPIPSAGLYVPKGRGSFPSMLYMLSVPARIAGVERVCIVTPPERDGRVDPACLYAASLCGIEEVYRIGGAQAIAALAFGTESIYPVAKIVGPGSIYVAAAKRILNGIVDVGLPAGPSESIILADGTADPFRVVLDLVIEAEHGSDSAAILVTPSESLAGKVAEMLPEQIAALPEPRRTFVTDVFSGYGGLFVTPDIVSAAAFVNEFAPEHLQIQTKDPFDTLSMIKNAGEILLGDNTPFSVANYATGANAVLPTGGKARTYSAVSVRDFIKYSSIIFATPKGYAAMKDHVITLSDYEGFIAHGNALKKRE